MSATNCPWCGKPGTVVEVDGQATYYTCNEDDCDFDPEEDRWEVRRTEISFNRTDRGFTVFEFQDVYGEPCTLQNSSLASEGAIWFGTGGRIKKGPPWEDVPIPDNWLVKSRMHLTQAQVAQILPYLEYFVHNGHLPDGTL